MKPIKNQFEEAINSTMRILTPNDELRANQTAEQCEAIADNLTIQFAKWLSNNGWWLTNRENVWENPQFKQESSAKLLFFFKQKQEVYGNQP